MTSVAQRKRAKRTSRLLTPAQGRARPSLVVDNTAPQIVREAGLDWLLARKRISAPQRSAGMRWGVDYRLVLVDGLAPLRSCLNDSPRGSGEQAGFPQAHAEAEARSRRKAAEAALYWQDDMIWALDAICGRQLTPWELIREIGGKQRDVETVQITLRLALDMLHKHYRLTNI